MAKRQPKPAPVPPPKDLSAGLFLELMMQMLAFFIMLVSMAVIVDEKRLAALGSLAGTFSPLPRGMNVNKGEGPGIPVKEIIKGQTAPKRTAKALTNIARELGGKGAVHVLPLDKRRVMVRFPEHIAFAPGQVELSPKVLPFIDKLAKEFQRPEIISIRIEGHTDDTPVNTDLYPSNWELSAARAMNVFLRLADKGVPRGLMVVAGMGDQHPIAGHPELDRRVDIILTFRPVTDKEAEGAITHKTPDAQTASDMKPKIKPVRIGQF
ncbi:MAG: flagellar motor protein [Zetaproteobacteria bacterium]|nr:MAG: flagellar motor protein [Zetaproteobacteria bacterium]